MAAIRKTGDKMSAGKGKNSQTFIVKIIRGRESNYGGKSNWSGKVVLLKPEKRKNLKADWSLFV